jgi:mannosyltransferase PIG-V
MAGVTDTAVEPPVEPPATPAGSPKPAREGWLATYRYPLTVFALSRVAVYLLIAAASWTSRIPRESGVSWHGLFGALGQWDVVWYRWIADHGYDPAIGHGNSAAFFPLYPLLWRPLSILPGPMELWGSLLSTVLFGAALCLLYRITLGRYDEAMARRTVLYLSIFPLAFVFSLPYAESLFLLLALGAFAFTWYGRQWEGAAVGALAVLARPVGIALLPALAWRTYRRHGLRVRPYLPLLLLPLAELAFFAYLGWRTGDVLANVHAQERGWERGVGVLPYVFGYRGRPPALPHPHELHRPVVRALLPGLADADPGRVPDLRGAPHPASDDGRAARLDRQVRHGRVPALLGAGRPRRGRARRHAGQDLLPDAPGRAGDDHVQRAHVHAVARRTYALEE